jgi:hypothetical protein
MAYVAIPTRSSLSVAYPYNDINQVQANFNVIFDANGKIYNLPFPATQVPSADANTLDDYEELNWTPAITFGGGSTGATYSIQTGYYTKIGNIVIITGNLTLTSNGSSSGDAKISGLPFTSVNNDAGCCAVSIYASGVSYANQMIAKLAKNSTSIDLCEMTEAGVVTTLTEGNVGDSASFIINLAYRVA